jgi:hypothetical protein
MLNNLSINHFEGLKDTPAFKASGFLVRVQCWMFDLQQIFGRCPEGARKVLEACGRWWKVLEGNPKIGKDGVPSVPD